jgi:hypothetical protein
VTGRADVTTLTGNFGTVDLCVGANARCRSVSIRSARGVQVLIPLQVTRISANHKVYATWRRNDEPVIRFERFEATAKVYDGELAMPS